MLNLTLTSGDGVKIGEDVQIVFESTPSMGRIKVSIEAPRDKNIARMPGEKKRTGNVVIVKKNRRMESAISLKTRPSEDMPLKDMPLQAMSLKEGLK